MLRDRRIGEVFPSSWAASLSFEETTAGGSEENDGFFSEKVTVVRVRTEGLDGDMVLNLFEDISEGSSCVFTDEVGEEEMLPLLLGTEI
ncbi:MAG: hypothetical protein C5B47_08460 [Verrucomicrobia bacterium]|nr:MAG: hypothetical protein C5B47_08460 [Verrucomicrobiota bacterium]